MSKIADWVKEGVTGTPGTGAITLDGARPGYIAFSDVFANTDFVAYVIEDGNNKEEGYGQLSAGTLIRTTVFKTLVAGVFDNTAPAPVSLTSAALVSIPATAKLLEALLLGGGASSGSVVTCSTAIPVDNTIPQITEGTAVCGYLFTPQFEDSTLLIEGCAQGSASAAGLLTAALFIVGTADSIGVSYTHVAAGESCLIRVNAYVYASGNSELEFDLRLGMDTGTFYANGDSTGAALFGGMATNSIKITEIRKTV